MNNQQLRDLPDLALIGQYINYKDHTYIIVKVINNWCWLLDPREGNVKRKVVKANIYSTRYEPAQMVAVNNLRVYLLTKKDLIISLTTGRAMKWYDNDPKRLEILSLSESSEGEASIDAYIQHIESETFLRNNT